MCLSLSLKAVFLSAPTSPATASFSRGSWVVCKALNCRSKSRCFRSNLSTFSWCHFVILVIPSSSCCWSEANCSSAGLIMSFSSHWRFSRVYPRSRLNLLGRPWNSVVLSTLPWNWLRSVSRLAIWILSGFSCFCMSVSSFRLSAICLLSPSICFWRLVSFSSVSFNRFCRVSTTWDFTECGSAKLNNTPSGSLALDPRVR